jgi:hypothetical protein
VPACGASLTLWTFEVPGTSKVHNVKLAPQAKTKPTDTVPLQAASVNDGSKPRVHRFKIQNLTSVCGPPPAVDWSGLTP